MKSSKHTCMFTSSMYKNAFQRVSELKVKEKGTHRINTGVVDPGPALRLLWLRTNLSWDGPYIRKAGPWFHFIVIFEPVLGAVLI